MIDAKHLSLSHYMSLHLPAHIKLTAMTCRGTRGTPRDIAVKSGVEFVKSMDAPPVRNLKQEERDDAEENWRSRIILELLSTERNYVQSLGLLVDLYVHVHLGFFNTRTCSARF